MYKSDKPINGLKQDALKRAGFCTQLAKAIVTYNYQDSLTIGLLGEWGSGKSSVINMTLDYIKHFVEDEQQPVIIYFNPWNYSEQFTLIQHFFDSLSNGLKKNKVKKIKEIGEYIRAYSNILRPAKYIPGAGQIIDVGLDAIEMMGKIEKKQVKRDFEELKEQLNKLLTKVDKKILIVIDDIDRLSSTEIKQVFQLVKKLADFPNTIYLLSFSVDIVVKSLKDMQFDNGYEYLKKIIQLPFNIPAANTEDIEQYLFTGLDEILEKHEKNFDKDYWAIVYTKSIKYYFKTLRDVNRFLNVFRFKMEALKGEVNSVDLIAITIVEVFTPNLFYYMQRDKEKFAEDEINKSLFLGVQKNRENLKQECDFLLNDENLVPKPYKELIKNLFIQIFPKWDNAYETYYAASGESKALLDKKCRIASKKFYDIYFFLSVPASQLSKTQYDNIISNLEDKVIVEQKILHLSDSLLIKEFLYRTEIDTELIDIINVHNLIEVLIQKGDKFQFRNEFGISALPNDLVLLIAITNLLRLSNDKKKRFEIISKAISECQDSIYIPIKLIIDNSMQHGRVSDEQAIDRQKQVLDLDDVLKLEELGARKLKEWADSGKLIKSQMLPYLLNRWKRLKGEQDVANFVTLSISNDKALAQFIKGFRYSIDSDLTGVVKRSYSMYFKDLATYLDISKVEPQVREIFNNKENILNDEEIDAVRLFLDFIDDKITERD